MPYIRLNPTLLFAALLLFSCNTPESRLRRLQHDFWENYARQDYFEIKLNKETLHWPLPPLPMPSNRQKSLAARLQEEAASIESEKMNLESRQKLAQIRAALDDCLAHEGNALFDPARFVLLDQWLQFSAHPELRGVLEKIPEYYAEVEQRWQMPDTSLVAKAVTESQKTLDWMNALEEKSGSELSMHLQAARAAIKDYIGMCQSALLK